MHEAFTHVPDALGDGNFDPGDLLIYEPDGSGLRTYHPNGSWSHYTVTPEGTCRVVFTLQAGDQSDACEKRTYTPEDDQP